MYAKSDWLFWIIPDILYILATYFKLEDYEFPDVLDLNSVLYKAEFVTLSFSHGLFIIKQCENKRYNPKFQWVWSFASGHSMVVVLPIQAFPGLLLIKLMLQIIPIIKMWKLKLALGPHTSALLTDGGRLEFSVCSVSVL